MIVFLSAEAVGDLEAIGDRIAADNPRRAASFVAELREKCASLSEFPERFPLVPRYEGQGVRHRVHGNYLIFYQVDRERVVILHILHGARDFGQVLFPGEADADSL